MHYRVIKMDGRYNRRDFQYIIEFVRTTVSTGVLEFDRSRRWFVEQYGWSQDVETRDHLRSNQRLHPNAYESNDINPVWAYSVEYKDYRIYVDCDQTMAWFLLCHPKS